MNEQRSVPHALTLSERKALKMSGVSEVISFDEDSVVLRTDLGTLIVQGQQLQLKTLSLEGGNVSVDGNIAALIYEEPRARLGWLRRKNL